MIPYFDGHRTAVKHLVQFHQTHVSTFFFFFFSLPMFMLRLVLCTFLFVAFFKYAD